MSAEDLSQNSGIFPYSVLYHDTTLPIHSHTVYYNQPHPCFEVANNGLKDSIRVKNIHTIIVLLENIHTHNNSTF